jgi:hypothetical protein
MREAATAFVPPDKRRIRWEVLLPLPPTPEIHSRAPQGRDKSQVAAQCGAIRVMCEVAVLLAFLDGCEIGEISTDTAFRGAYAAKARSGRRVVPR